jgi:hypothetical protein
MSAIRFLCVALILVIIPVISALIRPLQWIPTMRAIDSRARISILESALTGFLVVPQVLAVVIAVSIVILVVLATVIITIAARMLDIVNRIVIPLHWLPRTARVLLMLMLGVDQLHVTATVAKAIIIIGSKIISANATQRNPQSSQIDIASLILHVMLWLMLATLLALTLTLWWTIQMLHFLAHHVQEFRGIFRFAAAIIIGFH